MTEDELEEFKRRNPELMRVLRALLGRVWTKEDRDHLLEEQRKYHLRVFGYAPQPPNPPETNDPLRKAVLPPPVDPYARWREVILPPGVVLILGKRGGGKTTLGYSLLELFRYQLTPYLVGPHLSTGSFCPIGSAFVPTWKTCPKTPSP